LRRRPAAPDAAPALLVLPGADACPAESDMYLIAFPLLLVPFALYNMAVFLLNMRFDEALSGIPLLSGARMPVTIGDVLVILAVLLLYLEVFKATRLSGKAIVDHVLSFVLFIAMIVELIAVEQAATPTLLILTVLSLVDVVAGFTVSVRLAKRDLALDPADRIAGG
jgi:hypothetical protein